MEVDFEAVIDTDKNGIILNMPEKAVTVFKCNSKRHNGQVLSKRTENYCSIMSILW